MYCPPWPVLTVECMRGNDSGLVCRTTGFGGHVQATTSSKVGPLPGTAAVRGTRRLLHWACTWIPSDLKQSVKLSKNLESLQGCTVLFPANSSALVFNPKQSQFYKGIIIIWNLEWNPYLQKYNHRLSDLEKRWHGDVYSAHLFWGFPLEIRTFV